MFGCIVYIFLSIVELAVVGSLEQRKQQRLAGKFFEKFGKQFRKKKIFFWAKNFFNQKKIFF